MQSNKRKVDSPRNYIADINKEIFLLIENSFYVIIYSLVGSLFFEYFYIDAFNLFINGNGGFIGNYLNETFLSNLISKYENISYYSLVFLITIIFLISINFNLKKFIEITKKIRAIFSQKKERNYTDKSEIINEKISLTEYENLKVEEKPNLIVTDNKLEILFRSLSATLKKLGPDDVYEKNAIQDVVKIIKTNSSERYQKLIKNFPANI